MKGSCCFPVYVLGIFFVVKSVFAHSNRKPSSGSSVVKVVEFYVRGFIQNTAGSPYLDIFEMTEIKALSATFLISVLPFVILSVIPARHCRHDSFFIKLLLSFSVGSLLGDAFIHLIPHSQERNAFSHSHEEGEEHVHDKTPSIFVIMGICAFFVVEKLVRSFRSYLTCKNIKRENPEVLLTTQKVATRSEVKKRNVKPTEKITKNVSPFKENVESIKIAAVLNLASDFFHNFMDGMAIGSSFSFSDTAGIATTIGIFFHEIPHEISDFAILVKSGFSKWRAMFIQLITAIGAFIGAFTGVYLSKMSVEHTFPSWIMAFTAGGFIYIACVAILPDLIKSTRCIVASLFEVLSVALGVFLMYVIDH